jgi:mycothiol synthase
MSAPVSVGGEPIVRPPRPNELRAVFDLVTASDVREFGEPDYAYDEFAVDWENLDLAADSRVAAVRDGRLVGWATVEESANHTLLHAEAYVHPDFEGIGVGTVLVRWTEERAAEHVPLAPAGARVVLQNAFNAGNDKARGLFEGLGYHEVRRFWRMQIEFERDGLPAHPSWPTGIAVRQVADEADERRLFVAVEEAIRDHWGHVATSFETWAARKKRHGFDPGLWLMALDGEEVAGAAVGSTFPEMGGWVNDVAVRRPWRRRGLALALLLELLRRLAERGQTTVALGVDAASPTGATRLYEKAGMRAVREFVFYQKELRPGVELAADEELADEE